MQMEKILSCPYQNTGTYEVPTKDFGCTLFESLQKYSTREAYLNVESGEKITFDELKQRAESLARHLLDFGISKGDVIAIFSPNSIEWIIITAAALRIGVIIAAINFMMTEDELHQHLILSSAKVIYTTRELVKVALKVKEMLDRKLQLIVKGKGEGHISLESLLHPSSSLPSLPTFEELNLRPNDAALIMFSSGTTGPQKAVLLTHQNLQAQFVNMSRPPINMIYDDNVNYLPYSHATGFLWLIFPPLLGFRVLVVPRFNLEFLLDCLQKYKSEKVLVVPTVATLIAKSSEVEKFSLGRLKIIWCGAALLGPETEALVMERLPKASILQCYGLTEVTGPVAVYPCHSSVIRKSGSTGVPMFNIQLKIIDIKSGQSLGANQQGEICIRGPTVTPGYKDNPKATSQLIDDDGWLHSGDIGYYDDDGDVFIIDRIKDLIKFNAYQVAPVELDSVLLAHPQVSEACVFGIPDAKSGELPAAAVVLKPGSHVTETELEQFVAGKVAPYKRLRGGIWFVERIPKLSSGKLIRRKMKEQLMKARV